MKPALALVIAFILLQHATAWAQQPPYWKEIQLFKQEDKLHPPPHHAILFIGSSSFTKWKDVQSYFPQHRIINRGFGGSTLVDVIRYAGDIIYPYHPKQVVVYCGENDLAYVDTTTATTVLVRFKTLFAMVRQHVPHANIVFISIKPSPSRQALRAKVEAANALIKQFLATNANTAFVNVYNPMLNAAGYPRPELFLSDSLHMQPAGYAIWQKAIEPYLLK